MNRAKCPECGFVGWADAECCKKCGEPVTVNSENPAEQDLQPAYAYNYQQPAYASGYQNSYAAYQPEPSQRLAVTALVSGIVNFLFLGILVIPTIVGLIISAVALKKINRDPYQYGGKSLAVGGLVMNLVSLMALVPILIIAAIAIPNLLASRRAANEGAAIVSLRKLHNAEMAHYEMQRKYGTLTDLMQKELIAPDLADGERSGYRFAIEILNDRGDGWPGFTVVAVPREYDSTGRRSFFVDHTGVVRAADSRGLEATKYDPPLNVDYDSPMRSSSRSKPPQPAPDDEY
jgi:type II secretory pathway pseudopilin PulG